MTFVFQRCSIESGEIVVAKGLKFKTCPVNLTVLHSIARYSPQLFLSLAAGRHQCDERLGHFPKCGSISVARHSSEMQGEDLG